MSNYSVGGRIRYLRSGLNISQEQLALKSDITPAYLGQIEREEKNPTIKVVEKIVDVLGLSLSEFFSLCDMEIPGETPVFCETQFEKKIMFELRGLSYKEKQKILEIVHDIVMLKGGIK